MSNLFYIEKVFVEGSLELNHHKLKKKYGNV